MPLLRFHPLYQPRVWGGRALAERLGRTLPVDGPIGEAWGIADRPQAHSVDPASRKTLRELLMANPEGIMGPGYVPEQPFPILVKWLDCSQRLSLQAHPPVALAEKLGGEPKTECWYMADTTDDAALIVCLRKGVTRPQFEGAIASETFELLLHRFPVQPGQAMLLQSGRLHAIDAGNLILEIQQNSDTTYRVYDWSRKGLDGKPRQLHVEQSLQSIDFSDIEPDPLPPFNDQGERIIADCAEFRILHINLHAGQILTLAAGEEPRVLSVLQGGLSKLRSGKRLDRADNVLLPYAADLRLEAAEPITVLVTENFRGV